MDDATAQKMLASGNQVSVYYQGDNDSKKGWKKIEPIRIEGEGDDKVMVAYEIEGLGKKPVLKKYVQKKITNWNVLSTTPATIAAKEKEKEKKAPKKPGAKPPTPQKRNLGRQGDGICDAILNKRIVRMEYMGDEEAGPGWREDVEPVCYGSTNGIKYIRAWVGKGVSVSAGKNPENKKLPGWRFFRQDRIKKWEVDATKTFNIKRPDFREGQDALMSNLFCVADFGPDEPSEPKDLSTTLKESAMLSAIKEAINIF
jgi:predicted DNA-binding transcriptional regulator YafY